MEPSLDVVTENEEETFNRALSRYEEEVDIWMSICQIRVDNLIDNMNDALSGDREHDIPYYSVQFEILEVCYPLHDFGNYIWTDNLSILIYEIRNKLALLEHEASELWEEQHCKYEFDDLLKALRDFSKYLETAARNSMTS